MTHSYEYSLTELCRILGLESNSDADTTITGLATLRSAGPSHLSFYNSPRYLSDLQATRAGAVLIPAKDAPNSPVPALVSETPYVSFAKASALFSRRTRPEAGTIDPSAVVAADARLDEGVIIGPRVVVESGAVIETGSTIGAGCYIGRDVHIGAQSWLHPNITLYEDVRIGCRAIIHSGVIIGSDGFGFANDGSNHIKIEQLGGVRIGDDVEIGANTAIDRGALDNTVVEDGVKIDNLVHIAHNVRIGEKTILCGFVGIAGSSDIGANCVFAGCVGVSNHVTIADGVTLTARADATRDIPTKGVYSSGTGLMETSQWRRNMMRFKELDSMAKHLKKLLKKQDQGSAE